MLLDSLQDEIRLLTCLNNNLKKSINKKFRPETLQAKLNYANALYEQIEGNLLEAEDDLTSSELNFLVKAARSAITEIKEIISRKIADYKPTVEMANPAPARAFDIRQATALVQPYDGAPAGLDTFIDSVNLLKDLITAAELPMAVKFIKTRLSGKARTGLPDNIHGIDDIIENVRARCKDTTTPDNIIAKLKATTQKANVTQFCEEVDTLCTKLETSYISQQIPANVAKNMATKAGLTTVINGVRNSDTKLILKAGTFTSIKEILQKVQENDSEPVGNAQILATNRPLYTNRNQNRPWQPNNARYGPNRYFSGYNKNNPSQNRRYNNNYQGGQYQRPPQNYNNHPNRDNHHSNTRRGSQQTPWRNNRNIYMTTDTMQSTNVSNQQGQQQQAMQMPMPAELIQTVPPQAQTYQQQPNHFLAQEY